MPETTLKAAQAKANKCHVVKYYDGRLVGVWRYKNPAAAEQAVADHEAFMVKFALGYEEKGKTPPPRPWRLEIL